jgi:phosphatidylglycerophosphatase A
MVGLYLLNAAMVLGFALFTWFRMAKVAPIIST